MATTLRTQEGQPNGEDGQRNSVEQHRSRGMGRERGMSEADYTRETDLELQRSLGRLEGKVDSLIMQLTEHIKKDELAWDKVTRLEKKVMYAAGIVATIVFFITAWASAGLRKIGIIA